MLIERRYLAIYLNDHLAGATTGYELARRSLSSNRGTDFGDFLERFIDELADERETLRGIMSQLGVGEDRAKQAIAWSGEKPGRLKLNGELTSYSPLSRITELEGLYLGVCGKRSMWLNLESGLGEQLRQFELAELIARAEQQRERLEALRLDLAGDVLGEPHGKAGS